jgi:hypothetical protein
MPDNNGTSKGQAAPPALPIDAPEEKVTLPPTEADRLKLRLDNAAKENDDDRSKRRAKEIGVHFEAHLANVTEAHTLFPAPVHREWDELTDDEKKNWNERGKMIASANRAYHLAVKRTVAEHQAEDRHVAKLRVDAAKKENA